MAVHLVLASKSRDRKKLFDRAGISVEVIPSHFDESTIICGDPLECVRQIAFKKAEVVARRWQTERQAQRGPAIVIGADTLVFFQGDLIGKAPDKEAAFRIFSTLAGHTHEIYTGVALIQTDTFQQEIFVVRSQVHFQDLSGETIQAYLDHSNEFIGRAGAYSLYEQASLFIDHIEGSVSNIIGLPMAKLREALLNFGVDLLKRC
jgi:septum formation protein